MSGTSMDGIDAAIVRLGNRQCEMLAAAAYPYPADIRDALLPLRSPAATIRIDDLGQLDTAIGRAFCDSALALLNEADVPADQVRAIGSHGQTIRHQPDTTHPFTLQIGDPNIIAQGTGITTVADFRRRDLAAGGQGAPLAPAFHAWLLARADVSRAVLNLGGIANLTVLPGDSGPVAGFDVGPANGLMDAWIQLKKNRPFDEDGQWARSGRVSAPLLDALWADDYFGRAAPKSSGFEHFNLDWLNQRLIETPDRETLSDEDVQATLLALTVRATADAVHRYAKDLAELLICGGGTHNGELVQKLAEALAPTKVLSTAHAGLDPDWVEAAAFAWLASRTLEQLPGSLPDVTGAATAEILGAVYLCAS